MLRIHIVGTLAGALQSLEAAASQSINSSIAEVAAYAAKVKTTDAFFVGVFDPAANSIVFAKAPPPGQDPDWCYYVSLNPGLLPRQHRRAFLSRVPGRELSYSLRLRLWWEKRDLTRWLLPPSPTWGRLALLRKLGRQRKGQSRIAADPAPQPVPEDGRISGEPSTEASRDAGGSVGPAAARSARAVERAPAREPNSSSPIPLHRRPVLVPTRETGLFWSYVFEGRSDDLGRALPSAVTTGLRRLEQLYGGLIGRLLLASALFTLVPLAVEFEFHALGILNLDLSWATLIYVLTYGGRSFMWIALSQIRNPDVAYSAIEKTLRIRRLNAAQRGISVLSYATLVLLAITFALKVEPRIIAQRSTGIAHFVHEFLGIPHEALSERVWHDRPIVGGDLSQNGSFAVTVDKGGHAKTWRPSSGELLHGHALFYDDMDETPERHCHGQVDFGDSDRVFSIAVSCTERATATTGRRVRSYVGVFDAFTGVRLGGMEGLPITEIVDIALVDLDPVWTGDALVAVLSEQELRVIQATPQREVAVFRVCANGGVEAILDFSFKDGSANLSVRCRAERSYDFFKLDLLDRERGILWHREESGDEDGSRVLYRSLPRSTVLGSADSPGEHRRAVSSFGVAELALTAECGGDAVLGVVGKWVVCPTGDSTTPSYRMAVGSMRQRGEIAIVTNDDSWGVLRRDGSSSVYRGAGPQATSRKLRLGARLFRREAARKDALLPLEKKIGELEEQLLALASEKAADGTSGPDKSGEMPIGSVIFFVGSADHVPEGYRECDGSTVAMTETFARYNEILDSAFLRDGRARVPNVGGRSPVGIGDDIAMNQLRGTEKLSLELRHLPSHNHTVSGTASTLLNPLGQRLKDMRTHLKSVPGAFTYSWNDKDPPSEGAQTANVSARADDSRPISEKQEALDNYHPVLGLRCIVRVR